MAATISIQLILLYASEMRASTAMIAVQAIMANNKGGQSHGVPSNQWQYNLDFKPEFDRATNISTCETSAFHIMELQESKRAMTDSEISCSRQFTVTCI